MAAAGRAIGPDRVAPGIILIIIRPIGFRLMLDRRLCEILYTAEVIQIIFDRHLKITSFNSCRKTLLSVFVCESYCPVFIPDDHCPVHPFVCHPAIFERNQSIRGRVVAI